MSVRSEKTGPVTTVILARPEVRNAVDAPTARALADAFRAFEEDDQAKVAVLWGEGGIFCAGADLTGLVTERRNVMDPDMSTDGPMGPSRMLLSKPVIAAVAGHAVAGGLELAVWCDLRVAESSAVFGVFCRRWGVPLVDGGTFRLPRLIGLSRALDMILTGRGVTADEALAWGLANRVVPDGTSRDDAEKLALEISKFPQVCMRGDRRSAHSQFGMSIEEALVFEFEQGSRTVLSGEPFEGALRFGGGAGRHGSFED
jgi:enoyl-CoA hydratase